LLSSVITHSFRQICCIRAASLPPILHSAWTFATGMERAILTKRATLGALRDRSALFTDEKQWSIIVCTIGRTVASNTVVTALSDKGHEVKDTMRICTRS